MTTRTIAVSRAVSYVVRAQAPLRPSPPRVLYQLCIADSISAQRLGHQITDCEWVSGLWGPHAAAQDDPFEPDPTLEAIIAATSAHPGLSRRESRIPAAESAILDEVVAATRLMPFVSLVAKAAAERDRTDVAS